MVGKNSADSWKLRHKLSCLSKSHWTSGSYRQSTGQVWSRAGKGKRRMPSRQVVWLRDSPDGPRGPPSKEGVETPKTSANKDSPAVPPTGRGRQKRRF